MTIVLPVKDKEDSMNILSTYIGEFDQEKILAWFKELHSSSRIGAIHFKKEGEEGVVESIDIHTKDNWYFFSNDGDNPIIMYAVYEDDGVQVRQISKEEVHTVSLVLRELNK